MKRNIPIVLFITFLDYLSISIFFGTIIPLLLAKQSFFPFLIDAYDKSVIYGWCLLILPVGQFLIAPIWGQIADEYGRKMVLSITLLCSALGHFLMGAAIIAHVFGLFVFGRMIIAVVAVNMAIGQASLADISHGAQRTGRFNLQLIAISLGFIVGPYAISFFTEQIHYVNIYWVIAISYLLAFILIVFVFNETLTSVANKKIKWLLNLAHIFAIFRLERLKKIFLVWVIFQLGWSLFFQYSGEFLYRHHHFSNNFINHLFSWVGLGILLTQVCLVQPLTKKINPEKIIPWAILLIGVSLILIGILPINFNFIFNIFWGIYCVGIGFFLTNMYTYVSNSVDKNQQGCTMAMLSSSQGLADIFVTLTGSFVVAFYLTTPYVIGGAIVLFAGLIWLLSRKS